MSEGPVQGPIRLLICDDNEPVRLTLVRTLRYRKGIEVLGTASSFEELLDMIHALSPDIVLTDVDLPGLDGVSGLAKLRRSGNAVPVVVMSADERFRQPALEAGASSFFHKGSRELSELVEDLRKGAGSA